MADQALIAACHAFLSAAEETPDVEISIRNGLTAYAQMLRDAPDLVRALLARIADEDAERVADEFGIQSLTAENGVATLATVPTTEQARELVLAMSLACGRMLDDDQAQNYVEFEVSPANQRGYIVHVRRAGGPSPHTLRREAEVRAAKAEARNAELEQRDGYAVLCGDVDYEDVQLVGERVFADLEFALDAADGAGGTVYELREVNDHA
ncbi:hypothetical protein [Nocardia sp. NPDC004711]